MRLTKAIIPPFEELNMSANIPIKITIIIIVLKLALFMVKKSTTEKGMSVFISNASLEGLVCLRDVSGYIQRRS